jgi:hypothetical protein
MVSFGVRGELGFCLLLDIFEDIFWDEMANVW